MKTPLAQCYRPKQRMEPVSVPAIMTTTFNDDSTPGPSTMPTPTATQFQKLATLVEAAKAKRIRTRYAVVETLECSQCEQNIKVGELSGHLATKHPEAPATAGGSKLARFKSLTCRLMNSGRQPEATTKRWITRSKSPKLQSPQAKRATGGPAAKK